jgi:hypothetical protein
MTTWIILLWIDAQSQLTQPPAQILGPFTHREAQHCAEQLTCPHTLRKVSSNLPEWAIT